MKTRKILAYLGGAVLFAGLFIGCAEDNTFTPGPKSTNTENVYFAETMVDLEMDPADPTTLTYKAMRSTSGKAITVPVKVTSNIDGIFTVSEISFAADQTETEFTISFPNADVGVNYTCHIIISDENYYDIYGVNQIDFTLSFIRVKWDNWATSTMTLSALYGGYQDNAIMFQKKDGENLFRIVSPITEGYHFLFTWDIEDKATVIAPVGQAMTLSGVSVIRQPTGDPYNATSSIHWLTDPAPKSTFYDPATQTLTITSTYYVFENASGAQVGSFGPQVDTYKFTEFHMGNPWE